MLCGFKSKSGGDVLMTAPAGDRLLRLAGKEVTSEGIFEPPAVAAAMHGIEAAIAASQAQPEPALADDRGAGPASGDAEPVTLARHAWPLLEMIARVRLTSGPPCAPPHRRRAG